MNFKKTLEEQNKIHEKEEAMKMWKQNDEETEMEANRLRDKERFWQSQKRSVDYLVKYF